MASVAVNGEIYLIGGYLHPGSLSVVERYNPISDSWVSLQPLPKPLDHPAAVSFGDYIYVIGGLDGAEIGKPSSNVFRYSIKNNSWDSVSTLPVPLGAVSAVVVDGFVHVFGGLNELGSSASHYVYNIEQDTWATDVSLPHPNDHMAIATDGKKIFLTGGRETFPNSFLSRLLIFNIKYKTWDEGPALPTPRGDAQSAIVGKSFIVAGGENADKKVFDIVEAFDMEAMEWRSLSRLSKARHGHSAVSLENTLYLIGGRDKNHHWGYTNLNEKLTVDDGLSN